MAEAPDDALPGTEQSDVRYFCHQCSASIYPNLPDYTCPTCGSGFIEAHSEEANTDFIEPAQNFMELWERTFQNSPQDQSLTNVGGAIPRSMEHVSRPRGQGQEMDFLIHHILQTLTGNSGVMPFNMIHLHGNPGDYAWGEQGLDSIVTQLLNQLEGSGPPPATKEQLENLPVRTINDTDVERILQCSVCFEEYSSGEQVRCLPCQHVYHDDCIFPWLEKHGTCPVCRKDLNGKDTSTDSSASDSTNAASGFLDDVGDCD